MPKNTKVARCVKKVIKTGADKGKAIAICQKSTKTSYRTGKKIA